jgi:uncharacterized membrane protein YtjA (UPF0391 family)
MQPSQTERTDPESLSDRIRRVSAAARVTFFCYSEVIMMYWTLVFLMISLIAAVFGFTNLARESARIAKVLFVIFAIMFVASFAIQLLG